MCVRVSAIGAIASLVHTLLIMYLHRTDSGWNKLIYRREGGRAARTLCTMPVRTELINHGNRKSSISFRVIVFYTNFNLRELITATRSSSTFGKHIVFR